MSFDTIGKAVLCARERGITHPLAKLEFVGEDDKYKALFYLPESSNGPTGLMTEIASLFLRNRPFKVTWVVVPAAGEPRYVTL